jgi:hypothetical protein
MFVLIFILQTILGNTVNEISQRWDDKWRFLSFDAQKGHPFASYLNRKDWYDVISHISKPLLISLARLFFSIFRRFLQVRPPPALLIPVTLLIPCRLPLSLTKQFSSNSWTSY